jgi:hypothetical protein
MYEHTCAACHGTNGDGQGPMYKVVHILVFLHIKIETLRRFYSLCNYKW